jgi:NAD(P)-dependent dehydrogenase (short-subunit alcohol dehydrogenase family)
MKSRTPQQPLKGKVALITGGNRGIGHAIAHAFASEECDLVITGRDQGSLKKAAKQLGRKAVPIACDVRDPQAVDRLFAGIKKRFGKLDILINNAGVAHANSPVAKLSIEDWNQVVATNLTGMFLVTRAALPLMKRGAVIVNNLSVAAKRIFPGSSAYNASKHGALGFTNTLREEVRVRGIRVIALMAGATDTEIWHTLWPQAPRKKMMSPASVARAVVNALTLPDDGTVEELTIRPPAGTL